MVTIKRAGTVARAGIDTGMLSEDRVDASALRGASHSPRACLGSLSRAPGMGIPTLGSSSRARWPWRIDVGNIIAVLVVQALILLQFTPGVGLVRVVVQARTLGPFPLLEELQGRSKQ